MSNSKGPQILIIGGGLGGLGLAQSLRKSGISYRIFERDSNDHARVQGWALSLKGAWQNSIQDMLDDIGLLEDTSVSSKLDIPDGGSFYNRTGEKFGTLGGKRRGEPGYQLRSNRQKLRAMLSQHIDVEWNKRFVRYEESEHGVTAYFEDGTCATGDVLVGADGVRSRVREQLLVLNPLEVTVTPSGIIVGEVVLDKEQYQRQIDLGPSYYIAYGSTASRLFAGMRDVAPDQGSATFYWMYTWIDALASSQKSSYWTHSASQESLLDFVKQETDTTYLPKFTEIIHLTPSSGILTPPITMAQWAPPAALPAGRVTLLGDAAHPMVPFRGDGANNVLQDVVSLGMLIVEEEKAGDGAWVQRVREKYEAEMLVRGRQAVEASAAAGYIETEEDERRLREIFARANA